MTDQDPIRILLTGFGPFPGVRTNPSGAFLKHFATGFSPVSRNVTLRVEMLATSWTGVEAFVAGALADYNPHIALHFGIHGRADGFRIETRARNRAGPHADVDGKQFGKNRLVADAPPLLHATLPAHKLVHSLRSRGLPANPSHDAGRYLCNMLLYLSLKQAGETTGPRQTGFIHIPQIADAGRRKSGKKDARFDMVTLLEGAEIIANRCIVAHRRLARKASDAR